MVSDAFFEQIPGTALSPIHRASNVDFKSLGVLVVGKSAPTLDPNDVSDNKKTLPDYSKASLH